MAKPLSLIAKIGRERRGRVDSVERRTRLDQDRVSTPISLSVGAHAHWRLVVLRALLPTEHRARKSMSPAKKVEKDTNKVCCTHKASLLIISEKTKHPVEAEKVHALP